MLKTEVFRLPMGSPDDVSALRELIETGKCVPEEIVAIIAQTEGDGYARGYSQLSFELLLSEKLGVERSQIFDRIPMLMIGLTGGIMSPHYTVITQKEVPGQAGSEKRLAVGIEVTRPLKPEEIGRNIQIRLVAEAVKKAMKKAKIKDPTDVGLVEVKCLNLTPARLQDAQSRNQAVVSTNFAEAGNMSKGASALGVALGLGEIDESQITDDVICKNWDLYTRVGSTSAGNEQIGCKVVLFGNTTESVSDYVVSNSVMEDQLDLPGLYAAFRNAGIRIEDGQVVAEDRDRIVNLFVNAGANALPHCRNRRHTMGSDFLSAHAGIMAKAVINGIVGAVIGDSMILASAGWEHQGPRGSNLVSLIARVDQSGR
jgi:cyanuric acid amidohydrolase